MRNSFYFAKDSHLDVKEIEKDFMKGRDISYLSQVSPMIEEFTKEGDTILEPFCGMGTTVIAASLLGRNSIGIELEPGRFELLKEHLKKYESDFKCHPKLICADSMTVDFPKNVDAVVTNVPYYSAKTLGKTEHNNIYDIDSYSQYLEQMEVIIKKSSQSMKRKGYMILFCENIRDLNGDMIPQSYDILKIMQKYFHIKDERIVLYDKTNYADEFDNSHFTNRAHEYIFIGKKKDEPRDLSALKNYASIFTSQTDCRLIGSLGLFLSCPVVLDTVPEDVDFYAKDDISNMKKIIKLMKEMDMKVYSWQDEITDQFDYSLLKNRYYIRGIKGDTKVDVTYEIENIDYQELEDTVLEVEINETESIKTYNKEGFIKLLQVSERVDHKEQLLMLKQLC